MYRRLSVTLLATVLSLIVCGCIEAGERPVGNQADSYGKPERQAEPERSCHDRPARPTRTVMGKHRAEHRERMPEQPAKGESYRDPDYGVCIVRLTDHENEPPRGFARNHYSRRQAFNADGSMILVFSRKPHWHLYDGDSLEYLKPLDLGGDSVEPQWHPEHPDLLFTLPDKGGMAMYLHNVRQDKRRQVADFNRLDSIDGYPDAKSLRDVWPQARRVWTRWEGSPSTDARFWAFQVETDDGEPLGLITYDLQENRVTGTYDISDVGRPDHISMSPRGNFAVASWNREDADCPLLRKRGTLKKPCGLMVFNRDFSKARGLVRKASHSDMAIDANGREVIVIANYDSGHVEMIDLGTGRSTPLWSIYENGASTSLHVSGKAYRKPGWVLVSTYWTKDPRGEKPWYENKLLAVELKAEPRILNIASIVTRTRSYFSEPHAVVNPDFTRVLFNANWGSGKDDDVDAYIALLPNEGMPVSRQAK